VKKVQLGKIETEYKKRLETLQGQVASQQKS
jgi:hypothetical protein